MKNNIAIIGAGVSGVGAAVLAKKKGFNVFVSDIGLIHEKNKNILCKYNIDWEEKKHTKAIILKANKIIKSPGVPDNVDIIKEIKLKGISIISEIEFAFKYTSAKIVAITGSNGKTTTTLLLGHILKKAKYDVLIAGNIGESFAYAISKRDYNYVVLELSSFQLDGIKNFRSKISIILNITPDHLDRYDNNFDKYKQSKYRITKNQNKKDYLIYNIDDPALNKINTKAQKIPLSYSKEFTRGGILTNNKIKIKLNNKTMTIQELALQGKHNAFNSMAAAIAARVFEVKDTVIRQSMIDFQNVEHRLEYVITIHGVEFINDSKATNVNATWFALESMKKDIVWIVGGVDKGNDYSSLVDIVKNKVKSIICLGENNQNIISAFKGCVKTIVQTSSMQEAVLQSYNLSSKGDAVLLSPACASFDLFSNFEERGLVFKNEVRKL